MMNKSAAAKKKKTTRRVPSVNNETRGLSTVIILVIIAFVIFLGGGAFLLAQKSGLSGSIPLVKQALNPNCVYNDPELCKFMNKWPTVATYRTVSSSSIGTMKVESVYEIDGDDKFHMYSKQNGKESGNTITIGDTIYTLDYTDNKWFKQVTTPTTDTADTSSKIDDFAFDEEEAEADKSTYTFVAKEACGNLTCFKYEMANSGMEDGKTLLWFDDREYLLRKMSMVSKEGSSDVLYEYDNISIAAPSPTKEGEPGIGTTGMSEEEAQKMMKQYQQAPAAEDTMQYETPVSDDSSDDY